MESSASVQNRGQEMLLLPTAEKRGLFLQQSQAWFLSPLHSFCCLFVCIDGRCCSPRTKLRGTAISSSSWPFGIWEWVLGRCCAACSNSRWPVGASSSSVGWGMCCWWKHSLHWLLVLLGVGRLCSVGTASKMSACILLEWPSWAVVEIVETLFRPVSPHLTG